MQYTGVLQSRPSDVTGIAIGESHVNSRVADGEQLLDEHAGAGLPVQRSEYVSEVFYAWTPWPYLILRPNLQCIVHPGGSGGSDAYKNEMVVGLKTTVKF